MELNDMIMVMGTRAQVAASRMTSQMAERVVARPRLTRGPSSRWAAASGQPLAGPCPEGYELVPPYYDAWGNPKCQKKGDRPLAAPARVVPAAADDTGWVAVPGDTRGWCGPGEYLCTKKTPKGKSNFCCCKSGSKSCVGGKLVLANPDRSGNPVDWSRESALVRTSSPHMKANPFGDKCPKGQQWCPDIAGGGGSCCVHCDDPACGLKITGRPPYPGRPPKPPSRGGLLRAIFSGRARRGKGVRRRNPVSVGQSRGSTLAAIFTGSARRPVSVGHGSCCSSCAEGGPCGGTKVNPEDWVFTQPTKAVPGRARRGFRDRRR